MKNKIILLLGIFGIFSSADAFEMPGLFKYCEKKEIFGAVNFSLPPGIMAQNGIQYTFRHNKLIGFSLLGEVQLGTRASVIPVGGALGIGGFLNINIAKYCTASLGIKFLKDIRPNAKFYMPLCARLYSNFSENYRAFFEINFNIFPIFSIDKKNFDDGIEEVKTKMPDIKNFNEFLDNFGAPIKRVLDKNIKNLDKITDIKYTVSFGIVKTIK